MQNKRLLSGISGISTLVLPVILIIADRWGVSGPFEKRGVVGLVSTSPVMALLAGGLIQSLLCVAIRPSGRGHRIVRVALYAAFALYVASVSLLHAAVKTGPWGSFAVACLCILGVLPSIALQIALPPLDCYLTFWQKSRRGSAAVNLSDSQCEWQARRQDSTHADNGEHG